MSELREKLTNLKERTNWSLLFGVSFFLLVLFVVIKLTFNFSDWLVQDKDARLKQLQVLGEPHYTEERDIITAIKQADLDSFFELDVKHVQQLVTELPWVASASVRKQWPDTLQVYVVEHHPVAYWNDDMLLNTKGQVFSAPTNKVNTQLPSLFGPEGSEGEAWQTFVRFKELFAVNGLNLTSLALSERFAWQLWLDNGIRLNLGREEKAKRVQRFIDVYPHLKKRQDVRVDVVDLRYDTGLAVQFKPLDITEEEQKSKA
ncbi:cell division protein FtsQ/DivIB [Pseudoalteromonas sp. MM17-2]|uniref:cell division protein FtsQ/DivIB n=1 Tax=Pseudoalteromonas sp. MM17-2 TaxID=2917753 RepID=UPI001EF4D1A2|nr:cell division protein FtsQ/DivIB [Pseudoalteromonas sp. MM17-2]MCG7543763.1 cell division protein FtsQ/DivIB [Pseudoalteromonas sp. MM17-2]